MTDARDVIADWLTQHGVERDRSKVAAFFADADKLIETLTAAGLSITETPDEWEWGVQNRVTVGLWNSEDAARERVAQEPDDRLKVVRRRPAGPWEVAP